MLFGPRPLAFAAFAALALTGTTPAAAQAKPDPTWLTWDAATQTVRFKLIGGLTGGAKSPFNFNGFTDGEFTLTVPQGATVVLNFINNDGTPHSAEVIAAGSPIPNMAGDPAIPRAYTRDVLQGLAQGQGDALRFKADQAGEYRVFCGVPGHGLSGMWIRFTVSAEATEPSMAQAAKP
jgi:sulfocyanin